ncbi:MAG: hypothetical protein ACFNX0_04950 [Treponema sp.]
MRKLSIFLYLLGFSLLFCSGAEKNNLKKGANGQDHSHEYVEEFSTCIYTTEKYVTGRIGHSIILGDSNFSPKSDLLKVEAASAKCVYFSLADTELKPGITNLTSEDGAFEGAVIEHGLETDFKLDSPLMCVYDGKDIHLEGLARLYEPGTSIKSDKILNFTYDGPVKEGLFIDLWSNPAFKILKE